MLAGARRRSVALPCFCLTVLALIFRGIRPCGRAGPVRLGPRRRQGHHGRLGSRRQRRHHQPGHRPDPRGRHRHGGALQPAGSARRYLQPEDQPARLQDVRTEPGHRQHQQRHARRRPARSRRDDRHRDRQCRAAEAADRHRRGPLRTWSRRTSANLPVPLGRNYQQVYRDAARLRAPGQFALDPDQSVAVARVQRQRDERRPEQHAHRRRQHRARPAAARRFLCADARVDRGGQHRHQQHGCRTRARRRRGDQRADEERHQRRSTDRASSISRTST